MRKATVIGITGGTATGKGTLARAIDAAIGPVAVLAQDDYYHTKPRGIPSSEYNYDCPDAVELSLLAAHAAELAAGRPVESPVYVHAQSSRLGHRRVEPRPVVLVEGILIMNEPRLRACLDLAVYLDLDHATQLARRIARDTVERACTEDKVRAMWDRTVLPMQMKWVEPHRDRCDLVLAEEAPEAMAAKVVAALRERAA